MMHVEIFAPFLAWAEMLLCFAFPLAIGVVEWRRQAASP
jgi:hypothetical protein